jgi:hypothetical protein
MPGGACYENLRGLLGNIYIGTKESFSPKRQLFEKSCTKNFFELSE